MHICLKNSSDVEKQIQDFKDYSFSKPEKFLSVKSGGKTWICFGTLNGELSEKALKTLKFRYLITAILTLGFALFSKQMQEIKKSIESGRQERKIFADSKSSEYQNIARIVTARFTPKNLKREREEKEAPLTFLDHLKNLKSDDPNLEAVAFQALEESPEETSIYLFEKSEVSKARLGEIIDKSSKDSRFFPFIKKEKWLELSPFLSPHIIPYFTKHPDYREIALAIGKNKGSLRLINTLDPKTPLYKELIIKSLNEESNAFRRVVKALKEKPDLLGEIAIEAFQKNQGADFDLVILKDFPWDHPRFKELALLAVTRNPNSLVAITNRVIVSDKLKIAAKDYEEIARKALAIAGKEKAHAVLANIPLAYRPKK